MWSIPACWELVAGGQPRRARPDDDTGLFSHDIVASFERQNVAVSELCSTSPLLHLFGELRWVEEDDPVAFGSDGTGVAQLSQRADHDLAHRAGRSREILLRP
jgi:hypothetical protein